MRQKTLITTIFIFFLLFFGLSAPAGVAQTNPCPNTGPCDELPSIIPNQTPPPVTPPAAANGNANFDKTKSQMLIAITQVLPTYLVSIEKMLVETFWIYVPIFLGIIIGFSLLNGSHLTITGEEPFLRWLITAFLFIALLPFTADLNGDGRPGDIIGMFRYVGAGIAYGHDADGKIDNSSPLAYPSVQLKDYYNRAYAKFAQGAFTVELPDGVLTKPKPDGFIQRIRVMYSGGYKVEDIQKNMDPAGWNMNTLFEATNGARFAFEITDVVIMAMQAVLDLIIRVMLPLVVIFSIDPTIRKRILSNYLWFVVVVCFSLPICHQIGRIICYSIFDFVLYARSTDPYFLFDKASQSVIQQQDPTTLIFVFTALSWIFVFVFGFGVPALAYALTSGSLYQWFTGTFSAGFTALASTSLSFVTSAISGALSQEIGEMRAKTTREIGEYGVSSNWYRGTELARAERFGGIMRANSRRQAQQLQLEGGLQSGQIGAMAEYGQSVGGNMINFNAARSSSLLRALTTVRGNEIDWTKTSLGLEGKEMQALLRAHPEIADVVNKQASQIPVLGGLFLGDTVKTLDNLRGAFGGKLNNSDLAPMNKLFQLGNDGNGNFNSQLFYNNLYGAVNSAPNGAKLLSDFGLDPSKLQGEMSNGNYAAILGALPANNVPLFNQGDGRWGGRALGSGSNIKTAGCAMTATSMAISKISGRPITPLQLDSYLDSHGGYRGDGLNWQVAARAAGLQATHTPWNLQSINRQLDNGRPVVVGVDYKPGSRGGANGTDHWITLTERGVYQGREVYFANDPNGGKRIMMGVSANDQLIGGPRNYKTTGQLVTFQGGASHKVNPVSVPQQTYQPPPGIVFSSPQQALPNYQPSQMPTLATQSGVVPSHTPVMSSQAGNPIAQSQQTFGEMRGQQERMSVEMSRAYSPLLAEKVGIQNERDVSNYALQAGNSNAINNAAGEVTIAQNALQQGNELAQWKKQMSNAQNQIVYGAGTQAADIEYRGDTSAVLKNYDTQLDVARHDYDTGMYQQKLQFDQSMAEARAQTAISIISAVGQTAAHQLEEALEKTNSRL